MNNITFDSTGFSEQLGLYDFFNVLISGAIFVCGVCTINSKVNNALWSNLSFQRGLGIALLIYISGMILQELGSLVDRNYTNLYMGMHRSILKGSIDNRFEKETSNKIIDNPLILQCYRDMADRIIGKYIPATNWTTRFENEYINGYFFSVCQYFVMVKGKDKKSEKLRALFSMSKTLMSCCFLLAILSFLTLFSDIDMSIKVCENLGITLCCNECCIDKIIMILVFSAMGFAFYFRAKRTMKNFLLILLGTYRALLESDAGLMKANTEKRRTKFQHIQCGANKNFQKQIYHHK